MKDMHTKMTATRVISPVAVGTTGTGKTGVVVDRAGYDAVEFVVSYAVFTVVMKEGDVTGTLTSVADADMLGTELLAGLAAAATRTSGVSKNVTKRVGYKGNKRYVNLSVSSTVTAGTPIGVNAELFHPIVAPTSNP
jgi:hypothetical protein